MTPSPQPTPHPEPVPPFTERVQGWRVYARQVDEWVRQTCDKADRDLASRRASFEAQRQASLNSAATWWKADVGTVVEEIGKRLRARGSPRLWTELQITEDDVPDVDRDEALAMLELAERRLASPFRRKRKYVRIARGAYWRAKTLNDQALEQADRDFEDAMRPVLANHARVTAAARRSWADKLAEFRRAAAALRAELDVIAPPWKADWSGWTPPTEPVGVLRLGEHVYSGFDGERLELPAALNFPSQDNLVVKTRPEDAEQRALVLGILLRILASFPPGKVTFTFVDALTLGRTVTPLMRLRDFDERLVGARPCTNDVEIERRLGVLVSRILDVDANFLRGEFRSIGDYNRAVGPRAEPYHVLVVFDYPSGFADPRVRDRLNQVMKNGPRCGVLTVLLVSDDTTAPPVLALDGAGRAVHMDAPKLPGEEPTFADAPDASPGAGPGWHVELDEPPESAPDASDRTNVFTAVIQGIGQLAKTSLDVKVYLDEVLEQLAPDAGRGGVPGFDRAIRLDDPATWWRADATDQIAIPIGSYGVAEVMLLELGGESTRHHAMLGGKSGSGKTTLLHVIVTAAALLYSPDELKLYLVDFKEGVEFQDYATYRLPHARLIAINSEREFGLEVLRMLGHELRDRAELFRRFGVTNLAEYRQARAAALATAKAAGAEVGDTPGLPRVLLVFDEFQLLFNSDDPTARDAADLLDDLVRRGRAFGIHLLLSSQSPANVQAVNRATLDQVEVRVALQSSEADSRRLLAEDNPAARQLGRPGEAIYNAHVGRPSYNRVFQAAMQTPKDRVVTLEDLRDLAQARGFRREPVVYQGDEAARIERDDVLLSLVRDPSRPTDRHRLWLGEPVGLGPPVHLDLVASPGANLLVIGSDEANAGILTSTVLSLAGQGVGVVPGSLVVVDFTTADRAYSRVHDELTAVAPGLRRVSSRQFAAYLASLHKLVEERSDDDSFAAHDVGRTVFVVLHGVNRAKGLDNDSMSYTKTEPGPMTQYVLNNGPDVGVHVVATVDEGAVSRPHRTLLRAFGTAVTRRLVDDNAVDLVRGRGATKLRDHQALLVADGLPVIFRPYGVPPPGWMRAVADRLRADRSP